MTFRFHRLVEKTLAKLEEVEVVTGSQMFAHLVAGIGMDLVDHQSLNCFFYVWLSLVTESIQIVKTGVFHMFSCLQKNENNYLASLEQTEIDLDQ